VKFHTQYSASTVSVYGAIFYKMATSNAVDIMTSLFTRGYSAAAHRSQSAKNSTSLILLRPPCRFCVHRM